MTTKCKSPLTPTTHTVFVCPTSMIIGYFAVLRALFTYNFFWITGNRREYLDFCKREIMTSSMNSDSVYVSIDRYVNWITLTGIQSRNDSAISFYYATVKTLSTAIYPVPNMNSFNMVFIWKIKFPPCSSSLTPCVSHRLVSPNTVSYSINSNFSVSDCPTIVIYLTSGPLTCNVL